MQTSAWQCWPLCSICSDQRIGSPQKNFRGTQSAAKRKVVGVKRNCKASCGRGGAWGCGDGKGSCGTGLGRLACLSSEEEADRITLDVNKHPDTGADAMEEQVMPVQADPHVQCARTAAAATSEQLGAVATGCAVHAVIQHVLILLPAVRGCDAVCMSRLSCSLRRSFI
jgi:hypothetical protein